MTDIVTRLRQTRADMIGTDDEQHYWDCHDAAAKIERLRLAPDEREAIKAMASYFDTRGSIEMQAWGSLLHALLLRNGATWTE